MRISPSALEAARLIDRIERLARSGVPPHGLNPAQWEALRYLARANRFSRTPAGLAAYLGSTRGTVSQTLIALEQKGFVVRQENQRDRRSVSLGLTDRGDAALDDDPLLAIAQDLTDATGGDAAHVVTALKDALAGAITRHGGRPFGVCRTCRHHRPRGAGLSEGAGFCDLLQEPLSQAESRQICFEQEDA